MSYSQREHLRKNPASVPEENWALLDCNLKYSGLENFKDALRVEKQLTECIDTDAEEALFMNGNNSKHRAAKSKKPENQLSDRNDLFQNLSKPINIISQQTIKQASSLLPVVEVDRRIDNYKTSFVQKDDSLQDINTLQEHVPIQEHQLSEPLMICDENEIQLIKYEMSEIKNEICTMKEELKREYNKINISLDKIYKIVSDINVLPRTAVETPTNENDLLDKFHFPLSSCEEIQELDNEIRNNEKFKSQLVIFLSKIGGTSREEDGGKVAYKVIDQLFGSSVLINYSWTGVTRGKNSSKKKPFQILEGILDVFFQVISLADSRHTKQKNCNIFKECVLKYATKRSLRKRSNLRNIDKNSAADTTDRNQEDLDIDTNADVSVENSGVAHGEQVFEEIEKIME